MRSIKLNLVTSIFRNVYMFCYNTFYKWKMTNYNKTLVSLEDKYPALLDTFDKLEPTANILCNLLPLKFLGSLEDKDIHDIIITDVGFSNYDYFRKWLYTTINCINEAKVKRETIYVYLNSETSGYRLNNRERKLTKWLDSSKLINDASLSENNINLTISFFQNVRHDLNLCRETLDSISNNDELYVYYSVKIAKALQDVVIVMYNLNRTIINYEWK